MYIPEYDLGRLFDIPWISPLEANEYGAATTFRASDPSGFVDYSLNQLYGLLQPAANYPYKQSQFPMETENIPFLSFFQNQSRAQIEADAAAKKAEYEATVAREMEKARAQSVSLWDMIRGRTVRSGEGTGPIAGSQEVKSVDDAGMAKSEAGATLKAWFDALPSGSGVFLIGLAVVILIFLFVRR